MDNIKRDLLLKLLEKSGMANKQSVYEPDAEQIENSPLSEDDMSPEQKANVSDPAMNELMYAPDSNFPKQNLSKESAIDINDPHIQDMLLNEAQYKDAPLKRFPLMASKLKK